MPVEFTVLRNPPPVDSVAQKAITRIQLIFMADAFGYEEYVTTVRYSGILRRVAILPSNVPPFIPTNLFDIEVFDWFGSDILLGGGLNLSNVGLTQFCPFLSTYAPIAINSILEFSIENAGVSGAGALLLYIE